MNSRVSGSARKRLWFHHSLLKPPEKETDTACSRIDEHKIKSYIAVTYFIRHVQYSILKNGLVSNQKGIANVEEISFPLCRNDISLLEYFSHVTVGQLLHFT